jgi:hypothetical protein
MQAVADTRYSFTAQYLRGAAIFTKRADEIERDAKSDIGDLLRTEHRALVTAAIMQSVACIEADIAEITMHGPGYHLGSDGRWNSAHHYLHPLAEFIDEQSALERYNIVLLLLSKPPFKMGQNPWQHTALLVKLRNELVHYKSRWGKELDAAKLVTGLQSLKLIRPPFISSEANFFPHQLLGSACAWWAVQSAVTFLNDFYDRIGIDSPLLPYAEELAASRKASRGG